MEVRSLRLSYVHSYSGGPPLGTTSSPQNQARSNPVCPRRRSQGATPPPARSPPLAANNPHHPCACPPSASASCSATPAVTATVAPHASEGTQLAIAALLHPSWPAWRGHSAAKQIEQRTYLTRRRTVSAARRSATYAPSSSPRTVRHRIRISRGWRGQRKVGACVASTGSSVWVRLALATEDQRRGAAAPPPPHRACGCQEGSFSFHLHEPR